MIILLLYECSLGGVHNHRWWDTQPLLVDKKLNLMHSHMLGMQKLCIEFIPCSWVLALVLALALLLMLALALAVTLLPSMKDTTIQI